MGYVECKFGKGLKVAMSMKGVSNGDLAARIGATESWLSALRHDRAGVSWGMVGIIAQALDMPVSELTKLGEQR